MTYDPSRPGIPTLYNGIQFRSRLEAKWAAFFDFLGWKYEYEPFDLDGWIPDFLIKGKPRDILVEVKPVTEFPEDVADEMLQVCPGETDDDGYLVSLDHRLLLVGSMVPAMSSYHGNVMGWTYFDQGWNKAVLGQWKSSKRIGFCEDSGDFADCISGEYDGGCWGGGHFNMEHVLGLWREAGNRTQWKGKRQSDKRARRRPTPARFVPVQPMTREEMVAESVARSKAKEDELQRREDEKRQAAEQAYLRDQPIVIAGLDPLDTELVRVVANKPSLTWVVVEKAGSLTLRDAANQVILDAAFRIVGKGITPTHELIMSKLESPNLRAYVEELRIPVGTVHHNPIRPISWEARLEDVIAGHKERERKWRIRELEIALRNSAHDPNASPESRRILLEEYLALTTNRPSAKKNP